MWKSCVKTEKIQWLDWMIWQDVCSVLCAVCLVWYGGGLKFELKMSVRHWSRILPVLAHNLEMLQKCRLLTLDIFARWGGFIIIYLLYNINNTICYAMVVTSGYNLHFTDALQCIKDKRYNINKYFIMVIKQSLSQIIFLRCQIWIFISKIADLEIWPI